MRYELIVLNVFKGMKTMDNQSDKSLAQKKLTAAKEANLAASSKGFTATPGKTNPKSTNPLGSSLDTGSPVTANALGKRESSGDSVLTDITPPKRHRRSNWRLISNAFTQVDQSVAPMPLDITTNDSLPQKRKSAAAQILDSKKASKTNNEVEASANGIQGMQL